MKKIKLHFFLKTDARNIKKKHLNNQKKEKKLLETL